MRRIIALVAACTGLGCMQSAAADYLRCGDVLIEPGDAATYVLENCFARPDTAYQVSLPQLQRWKIVRGPGQFPAVVVIGADGRVEAIEFERHRD